MKESGFQIAEVTFPFHAICYNSSPANRLFARNDAKKKKDKSYFIGKKDILK